MEDLSKLLKVVESLDADKRNAEEQPPTDDELNEARRELEAAAEEAGGDNPDVESLRAIAEAISVIDAEVVTRTEAREAERAEAAQLLDAIKAKSATASDANGEGEGDANGEGEGDGNEEGDKDGEGKDAKVAVAASLSDAIRRSSARKAARVERSEPVCDVMVAAAGAAQGFGLRQDASIEDAADLFSKYAPQVKRGGSVLVHMDKLYPEDRSLGLSAQENTRTIDRVVSPRAITAAGGICEPLPADFSHPICGERGRPITNQLPSFRADRGGARYAPSATVADLESAITVWTHETDASPGSDTKACPRVVCDEELSTSVDAVAACLTIGNFQARFNPEFWRSRLDLLMVAHDRVAEQTAYATIESNSTQVTFTGGSGTVVDVLTSLDKAVAALESRHRLGEGTTFPVIMPTWLQDALRAHLTGQLPAGSLDLFSVADAQLNAFFGARNIRPVWSPDIDLFGAQNAGALDDFPGGDAKLVVFPEGTWMFFDGGTLDLGTQIVDSTLNATNDRQAFMETFEAVAFRGCESLSITVPIAEGCICPGGLS